MHKELERRNAAEIRRKTLVLWQGEPTKDPSRKELIRTFSLSEAEAMELESHEQAMIDQEVAKFSRLIQ